MGIQYIFRLDDICPDMNYVNFSKIRDLFFKYNVRPIIGVIPHNEDEKLKRQTGNNGIGATQFWQEIQYLQDQRNWSIALHGYNHVYVTDDAGIFGVNKRAEFAGLPLELQQEKIKKGKAIFSEQDIRIDAFMAPAHSMDWNTVEALKKEGIFVVTDGRRYWPYFKRGMFFVSQIHSWPSERGLGIHTVCLHTNEWDDEQFEKLEEFLKKSENHIISFSDIISDSAKYKGLKYALFGGTSFLIIKIDYKLRTFINDYPRIKEIIKKVIK